jgi:hypothetical protein
VLRADPHRRAAWPVALALASVLAGCSGEGAGTPPPPPAAVAGPPDGTPFRSVRTLPPVAEPARLRLASIGVDAPVTRLGTLPDGSVEVPSRWEDVGWYGGGPRPGEPGPAVLLGHVDSKAGPAVFARLGELQPGDVVEVEDAGGGRKAPQRLRGPRVAREQRALHRFGKIGQRKNVSIGVAEIRSKLRTLVVGEVFG